MGTNKNEIINSFNNLLKQEKSFQTLYKNKCLNQKTYTEDYSDCLLKKGIKAFLNQIEPNEKRKDSYKVNHDGITEEGKISQKNFRWEERECIAFYNYYSSKKKGIRIIDYQMPLRNTKNDKEHGVDLVASDGENLIILEYKRYKSKETLLRSALEIYTYKKLLQKGKSYLLENYKVPNGKLIAGIFFLENSNQHKSFQEMNKDNSTIKLIKELGIKFYLGKTSEKFDEDTNLKKSLASKRPKINCQLEIMEL